MKTKLTQIIFPFLVTFLLLNNYLMLAQNWSMLNYDKERTSWVSDETILYPPLTFAGEYSIRSGGTRIGDISLHNNVLCLAVQKEPNTMEVIDILTGDTLWTFDVPNSRGSMNFTCTQNDSLIFVGGQQGLGLYALDRATGVQKWHKPIGSLYTKNLILDNELGYVFGDSVYCLNINNGETVWSKPFVIQGTPAVDDLYIYIIGYDKIQVCNKLNGELVWSRPNTQSNSGSITIDSLNFYTHSSDTVFSFNKETWDVKWIHVRPGDTLQSAAQNSFAITDTKFCFTIRGNGEGNGQLVTLDKETGEFIWEQTFIGNYVFAPVIANNIVYVVPFKQKAIYGFDLSTGAALFYDDSAPYVNQPIVANHRLYAVTHSQVLVFESSQTNIDEEKYSSPKHFSLSQNYPNPFNPSTKIRYIISESGKIQMYLFDVLGRKIKIILNEHKPIGNHEIELNAEELPNGIYFYKLVSGAYSETKKMVLLK